MPLALSVRHGLHEASYRDTFVRAMEASSIVEAHIASGFFTDFISMLEWVAPDFSISEEMRGKKVFLYGGYSDADADAMRNLRDALCNKGLDASAHVLDEQQQRLDNIYRWHAKIAVFHSDRPVIAVVGSSNLTGPSMFGASEHRNEKPPYAINIEADTFYWLRGDIEAGQAMHDVFSTWGQYHKVRFNRDEYDSEVEKLINTANSGIFALAWKVLP